MSEIVISVRGLSKRFRLKHGTPRRTLREDVLALPRQLASWWSGSQGKDEDFWALRDVSFDLKAGEVVGVIGRNGAGKSTLLKILSRVLEPTCGEALVNGRIGSLLEVGTGFHPELTGRENIFLSGALLGMRRTEVRRRFDEIVCFAGVEKFIDTPCKHYSSGMYARLGFAVAAHLDCEMLLVDEVLAIGDAEFQRRCLGKMSHVARSGRAVLFVSHHMAAVRQFCTAGLVLEKGSIHWSGADVGEAISCYNRLTYSSFDSSSEWHSQAGDGDDHLLLYSLRLMDEQGATISGACGPEQRVWFEVKWRTESLHSGLSIGYALRAETDETLLWSFHTDDTELSWVKIRKGINVFRTELPREMLNEGTYRVEFLASLHPERWLFPPGGRGPGVVLTASGLKTISPFWTVRRPGFFAPLAKWTSSD